jgi:hypothetical protein
MPGHDRGAPNEGEIPADALLGLKPPKLDTKIVEVLDTGDLARLLRRALAGT